MGLSTTLLIVIAVAAALMMLLEAFVPSRTVLLIAIPLVMAAIYGYLRSALLAPLVRLRKGSLDLLAADRSGLQGMAGTVHGEIAENMLRLRDNLDEAERTLEGKLKEATRELLLEQDIENILTSSLDFERRMPAVLTEVLNLFGYSRGFIIARMTGTKLIPYFQAGPEGITENPPVPDLSQKSIEVCMESREIKVINDVNEFSQNPQVLDWLRLYDISSLTLVTLVAREKPIGILLLGNSEPLALPESEMKVLKKAGIAIGAAFEDSWIFGECQEVVKMLKLMRGLLETVQLSSSWPRITGAVLDGLYPIIPFKRGFLALPGEGGSEFLGIYEGDYSKGPGPIKEGRLPVDGSCPGWVMRNRQPVLEEDIRANRQFHEDLILVDDGYYSRICYPLLYREEALGALHLAETMPCSFTDKHLLVLKPVTELLAIVLMISSLQQSLDAMKDKLSSSGEKLQEYITAVNQELSSSLHVIHEESRMLADRKVSGIKAAMQGTIDRVVALSREMILKVDQLRDYSIAYRSDGEILVEQFYLVEPLQEVMWDIEKIRTDRKVQIDFEIPKGMPPAYADIPKFKSILRNLLMRAATGNGDTVTVLVKANLIPYSWLREKAADFMPPYVEESLRHDCDIVLISVSDDGPALVEEQPGSLFEPELSGDKVNFGLAVAKNFVEIHGGQIWYERTAEERNRFSFYLPLISEDRRVFMNYMTKRIKQAKDQISCLSVIVVAFRNLDFLREEQGEEQFMRVLKDVERVVKGTIREPMDTLRKYRGGEIFAIFAETERAGTRAMRERLERAITEYSGVRGPKLSFKMTTATYPDDAATTEMMLEVLDREVELDL